MTIRATILIAPADDPAVPNALTRVQQAARRLEDSGFQVLSLGRLGVHVRAERITYQDVLGLEIPRCRSGVLRISAPMERLVGLVSQLTFAPDAQRLA